jgi:excisionase family DNA binding protein
MGLAHWSRMAPDEDRFEVAHAHRRSVFVEDAATLLGVSRRTIYYRIREGRLRTIRTSGGSQRVLVESVEELLREQVARQSPRRWRLR